MADISHNFSNQKLSYTVFFSERTNKFSLQILQSTLIIYNSLYEEKSQKEMNT